MKRSIVMTLGLLLLAAAAHTADAQQVSTGDRRMDSILRRINAETQSDPDLLVNRLGTMFQFPVQELREARDVHGLDPASLYMSAALARATQRPVLAVAGDYRKHQGKGWGVVAREMGIKPGSQAFHDLKRSGQGCVNHIRADKRAKQKHEKQLRKERDRRGKDGSGHPGGR